MIVPSRDDVETAARRIAPFVHRTPVVTSTTLDAELGAKVFLKAENLQRTGSFKARGATNAVWSLTREEVRRGVVTHSSGNHGQALAYASATRGIACRVVMPDDAPQVKRAAVEGYGAQVITCRHTDREAVVAEVQSATGAVLVPPFDDPRIVAGQGTVALELLAAVPDLDVVVAPIGGGGLLAGIATVVGSDGPAVIGAEPAAADDAHRSLRDGDRRPAVPDPATVADGLRTGIGALPFAVLARVGAEVVLVEEQAIRAAVRWLALRVKLVVEPSGAVGLAALRSHADRFRGSRVGLVLSGGNLDLDRLR